MTEILIVLLLLSPLAVLLALLVVVLRLRDRVNALERRINLAQDEAKSPVLSAGVTGPPSGGVLVIRPEKSSGSAAVAAPPVEVAEKVASESRDAEQGVRAEADASADRARIHAGSPATDLLTSYPPPVRGAVAGETKTQREWEQIIGGRWLNLIGAVALIIAAGFFLKYAFDKDWIPDTARVLIGAAAGLALIAGGLRFEKRGYQVFSQGLLGAGIAILYLSVYASFNFYRLAPQMAAFALMSAVTIITFALAVRYDSLAISLLGWAGGFLTPIMLSTGSPDAVGLFGYLALLDLGLLAVLSRKERWFILEPLTVVATWILFVFWYDAHYSAEQFVAAAGFAALFWAMFLSLELLRAARAPGPYTPFMQVVGGINTLVFALLLHGIISSDHEAWAGAALALVAAAYALCFVLIRARRKDQRLVHGRLLITSVILAAAAAAAGFDEFLMVAVWSAGGFAALWLGMRINSAPLRGAALSLLALSFLTLLGLDNSFAWADISAYIFLLNERTAAYLAIAAFTAAASMLLKEGRDNWHAFTSSALLYVCCLTVFLLVSVETSDRFRAWMYGGDSSMLRGISFQMYMTVAAVWGSLGMVFTAAGLAMRRQPVMHAGLAALSIAVVMGAVRGIVFDPSSWFAPVLNIRAAALGFLVVLMFLHLRLFRRYAQTYPWLVRAITAGRIVLALLLLVLLTAETRDVFQRSLDSLSQHGRAVWAAASIERTENLKQLSLSGLWLVFSIGLMTFGILRRTRSLRIAAFALFGVSILKIFIYDLSSLQTLYRIFSFGALGVILLLVSFLYQRYKELIFGDK